MPSFDARDPSQPAFWSERFEQSFMPWDKGGVPAALKQFVAHETSPRTVLIPGCGSGHEVAYLCEAGWDVTAIDSPAAVAHAKAALGPWSERVLEADFFEFIPEKPLTLIYERAFLCALPPQLWPAIAARWAALLPPGGLLAGFFFVDDEATGGKGPPFPIRREDLVDLLAPHFEQTENTPVTDSIAVFAGKEYWQVWRRLA